MRQYLSWIPIESLAALTLVATGVLWPNQSVIAQAPPVEEELGEAPAPDLAEPAPAEPAPEPEEDVPLAPTQSTTPVPPPAAAAVPSAPAVPVTLVDGEAPPGPIAPAFPPAIPNIDYGARMRIVTRLQNPEDPESFDDVSQQAETDIYMGGALHRMLKWQASVTFGFSGALGSSAAAFSVAPLDLIARFEPIPEFNIYMGRMIVVSDRYTPSGPWGMDQVYYPGLVGLQGAGTVTIPPALQKAGPNQRDLGINVWGAPLGGHLKYYLGVYQLQDPAVNPLLSGRLQVSLLSPEPAFYQRTTYMGTRDLISFGVGGQYQSEGSVRPANMATMMPAAVDDYSYVALDANIEKILGNAGTLQVYGTYFMFEGDFQRWDSYWMATVGYLLPKPIGIGKIRFSVRYQRGAEKNEMADDASILDAQISYNIIPWFARFQLGFRRMEWFAAANPTTMAPAQLATGNQIYLGLVFADP